MDIIIQNEDFGQKVTKLLQKYPIILQLCRFVAIGFLNTALNFIVSNLVSKYFNIEQGNQLGLISGLGFLFATTQSYYWNKDWAFGQQADNLLKNFLRLLWVGFTGVLALVFVLVGSKVFAPYYFYLIILIIFLLAQLVLWKSLGLSGSNADATKNPFLLFFVVSLIGFAINMTIVSQFSSAVHLTANADLNKNVALIVATAVSLIWNFAGYKIFVFKK